MGISWLVLSELFRDHAVTEFLDELDHHATELANLTEFDAAGAVTLRVPLSDHRFAAPNSGFYWQIERPGGEMLRSPSLGAAKLALQPMPDRTPTQRSSRLSGPTGELLLLERVLVPAGTHDAIRIAVGTDQRLLDEFLATFKATLAIALASIATGLIAAAFAQVAFGLRPLRRIRQALLDVRVGARRRLPDDLPEEVAPLAANVNALLDANDEMVRRARIQASNLAHALKTPLAVLTDEGARLEASGQDGRVVLDQCARMRRQIDYQLAKARAAASRIHGARATQIWPAAQATVAAIERLYLDRGIAITMTGGPRDVQVACEPEDLDEILGNLIDNAAKWAQRRIQVTIETPSAHVAGITVEDDGPGIPAETRERVFEVGERLDEHTPGTGLGLAIVRDVVTLYGGRTWIDVSDFGGAAVHVELPTPPVSG